MASPQLSIDLNSLIPTEISLTVGKWTITSPVPDTDTGRLLMAAAAGAAMFDHDKNTKLSDETVATLNDLPRLVLGEDQVEALEADGCPELVINKVAIYAAMYWLNGPEAARAALEAQVNSPKDRKH